MEKLEKDMQRYINDIDSKLKRTKSDKLTCLLMVDLHKIFEMRDFYKLNINIPNSVMDKYDRYSYFLSVYKDVYQDNYFYMYDENRKVADLYHHLNDYYGESYFDLFKVKVSDSDILSYTNDFFNYYDKDIASYFKYLVSNDKVHINMKYSDIQDADGYSVSIFNNRDGLVFVNGAATIEVASTLIHEVVHSYVESFDYDINYLEFCNQDVNNLHDVYPSFIELVFLKYLEEIKFDYSDIRSLATGNYATSIMRLGYFDDLVNKEKADILFDDAELMLDFIDNENYSYSFILSEYFFNKYLKDPDKCKNDILEFMLDTKRYDKKELLGNIDSLVNKKKILKNMKNYYGY